MVSAETRAAIDALNADYWRRVDRVSPEAVDELYVEDGVMHIGSLRREGRTQICDFFAERNAKELERQRTTRHLSSALWIESLGVARLRVQSTVQVLSGHGEWPMASALASTVADFEDIVVAIAPGQWRYESRRAQIIFTGAGAAAFAR